MLRVCWLLQQVADVPEGDAWLSPSERDVLARFWAPKRIRDWRLGRWTGKRALALAGAAEADAGRPASLARVSIRANEAGSPCVFVDDREAAWVLSLSHAGEYGACAVARAPAALGCDVENVGRRGEEFVVDWFTDAERGRVEAVPAGDRRSRAVTLVWSAKESALKTLGVGLRLDTREVEVETQPDLSGPDWSPLVVRAPGRILHGWWCAYPERVLTIVSDPPPALPVALSPEPSPMADLLECLLQVKGLRETCDRLSNLAAAFDASRWTARPPGGGPSAIDLLWLLVELEVVHGGWLRQILATAGPRLPAADERALLELASRHGWNVPDALDRFLAHRRASLDLLDRCSAADFSRTATHPTRRELTLADVVAVMMASDAERVGEIRRALTHEGPKVPGSEGAKV